MNTPLILFIIAFILPIAYQRIHFFMSYADFLKPTLRHKVGLQIHHAHWGLLWIFLSSIWLAFSGNSIYVTTLLGFGWGLFFDEIIPHLRTPSDDRHAELTIYKASTKPTLILAAVTLIIIFLFSVFIK